MKSYYRILLTVVLGLITASSCGGKNDTSESNTNWMRGCTTNAQCGEDWHCQCGVCTQYCDVTEDCESLGESASCVASDAAAFDGCVALRSVCLPGCSTDTDCGRVGDSSRCVGGSCAPPPGAGCPHVASSCPEGCQPFSGNAFDLAGQCLRDPVNVGCWPQDAPWTTDIGCAKRTDTSELFYFGSGMFASAVVKDPEFEDCTNEERSLVFRAGSCSDGACAAQGASCAGGETCCGGLTCCGGVPIEPGSEFCSDNCPISDRNLKRDIEPVSVEAVLDRLMTLPVSTWSYRAEPGVRHIGPMAQDFQKTFDVGGSDRTILQVDGDGVALAAIQALALRLERVRVENAELKARISMLETNRAQPVCGGP